MAEGNKTINLSKEERVALERLASNRNTPAKVVWRARIVLATASGLGTTAICREVATVGTGCAPAAGVGATAIGGVLAAGQGFIPLTDDVFGIARPTTTDVWGTAFLPAVQSTDRRDILLRIQRGVE